MLASDQHIRSFVTVHVLTEAGGINRLVGDGIVPVPTQDVVSGAPNQNVRQKIRQPPVPALNQLEVLLQISGIDWKIGLVVLMKELDLVVNVPRALVSWGRCQEADLALARGKESLQNLVPLSIGMSEVVALIHQHKVAVAVLCVIQQDIPRAVASLIQVAHRKHTGIQLVSIVVEFPHLDQRCRANNEGAGVVSPLEVLHNGCADVALS